MSRRCGGRQVGLGVDRPEDRVVRDAGVEPADERLEERHAAGAVVEGLLVDHGGKCMEASARGPAGGGRR